MIEHVSMRGLERARIHARDAARWLQLLQFRTIPGGPTFAPDLPIYDDMMSPDASDERRLAACRMMQEAVHLCAAIERRNREGELLGNSRQSVDPYGLAWRTTLQGAALETAAENLDRAIAAFAENEAND